MRSSSWHDSICVIQIYIGDISVEFVVIVEYIRPALQSSLEFKADVVNRSVASLRKDDDSIGTSS